MKKTIRFEFVPVYLAILLSACTVQTQQRTDTAKKKPPTAVINVPSSSYSIDGLSFTMKKISGGTFPTGTDDAGRAEIKSPFLIAETEVTYELWYKVAVWAKKNGYSFVDAGREGNLGADGAAPSRGKNMPAAMMTWRDAVVWCNALTEYYNSVNGSAPDLDYVYYADAAYSSPFKKSTSEQVNMKKGRLDNPYIKAAAPGNMAMENCSAKGFRLPSAREWECAARWRGTAHSNAILLEGQYWTKGNAPSGSDSPYSDSAAAGAVAWYDGNSSMSNPGTDSGKRGAQAVKGRKANALGLYDMSGNVYEWCFDWMPKAEGAFRMARGGCYNVAVTYVQCGFIFGNNPWASSEDYGFRIARTD